MIYSNNPVRFEARRVNGSETDWRLWAEWPDGKCRACPVEVTLPPGTRRREALAALLSDH